MFQVLSSVNLLQNHFRLTAGIVTDSWPI